MGQGAPPRPGQRRQPLRSQPPALLWPSQGCGSAPQPAHRYTRTEEEISLILDEDALDDFPPDAIVGSPSVWRAFKLCGRLFSFDETGVVSAMYAPYERGVSLLNISTFVTNITLVEESAMDRTPHPNPYP